MKLGCVSQAYLNCYGKDISLPDIFKGDVRYLKTFCCICLEHVWQVGILAMPVGICRTDTASHCDGMNMIDELDVILVDSVKLR